MKTCLNCGEELKKRHQQKYCSNVCQMDLQYKQLITEWKDGKKDGLDSTTKTVTRWVKKYLREKYDNKCCKCGWSERNPYTGKVPLVADHIDGNALNNTEENLQLICWNCDSLGPTFGNQNKGNGRVSRYFQRQ